MNCQTGHCHFFVRFQSKVTRSKAAQPIFAADRGDSAGKTGLKNPMLVLIPKMISAHPRQLKNGVGRPRAK
jgi:hypothetical protein